VDGAREAANLYYSRLKVADNQTQAKADMTYVVREVRHMGMAMGLGTLKFTSIDIRAVIDYMIFNAQGILGIPRDLWWIFNTLDPSDMRRYRPGDSPYWQARAAWASGCSPSSRGIRKRRSTY